jgi:hypothetical protein
MDNQLFGREKNYGCIRKEGKKRKSVEMGACGGHALLSRTGQTPQESTKQHQ